jgi:hypothetical protein
MASLEPQIQKYIEKPEFSLMTPQDVVKSTPEIIFKRAGRKTESNSYREIRRQRTRE